jgi:hypothetical protein
VWMMAVGGSAGFPDPALSWAGGVAQVRQTAAKLTIIKINTERCSIHFSWQKRI